MGFNFDISYSGLNASVRGIQVAQNNVANADTKGYVRQRLETGVNVSITGSGQSGMGVVVKEVSRIRNELLIQQTRSEQGQLGYSSQMKETLSHLEVMFGENAEGSLSSQLQLFFNGWEELSKAPEQYSLRESLLGKAEQLASKFNTLAQKNNQVKLETEQSLQNNLKTVNELAKNIARLNAEIRRSGVEKPNALMDERDQYLDELAKYADISVSYEAQTPWMAQVKIGGALIVSNDVVREIEGMYDAASDEWILHAGSKEIIPGSGIVQAQLEMRNTLLPRYGNDIHALASALIGAVNTQHAAGYGLDSSTGQPFFAGSDASTITVANGVKTNPNSVAASSETDITLVVDEGNGENAKSMSALQHNGLVGLNGLTVSAYYQSHAVNFASDLQKASNDAQVREHALVAIQEARQAAQGVNLDEEMANLLKFQRAYAANAKALQTADQLNDVLLQLF